ncbi:MAG: GNAT family N-acetyltransferase [Dehalococcoidales bacterium]|nr:GNAT family N-acetyltransferase [Dehalococcoidales bacterium]
MVSVLSQRQLEFRQPERLMDGSPVLLRPITPEDKQALLDFHARQSTQTRFFRYHYSKGELTAADLRNFCEIDFDNSLALVVEMERNHRKEIVGVGRFYRLPTSIHTAEVAFVVQDSEQRKGIGTMLLKYLAKLAWDRDIYFFTGEVLRENGRILSIFTKSDPEMHYTDEDDHTCIVTLSIREIMDRVL